MTDVRAAYDRAIAAYNAGDVDAFADAHAAGAVLTTPAGTVRGRVAIREYWRRQRVAFPDLTLAVDAAVVNGDLIATEWTWTGTNTGLLTTRDRTELSPTGRRVELKGMELAHVRDGKIVEYRMYWDGIALAKQLRMALDPGASAGQWGEPATTPPSLPSPSMT